MTTMLEVYHIVVHAMQAAWAAHHSLLCAGHHNSSPTSRCTEDTHHIQSWDLMANEGCPSFCTLWPAQTNHSLQPLEPCNPEPLACRVQQLIYTQHAPQTVRDDQIASCSLPFMKLPVASLQASRRGAGTLQAARGRQQRHLPRGGARPRGNLPACSACPWGPLVSERHEWLKEIHLETSTLGGVTARRALCWVSSGTLVVAGAEYAQSNSQGIPSSVILWACD